MASILDLQAVRKRKTAETNAALVQAAMKSLKLSNTGRVYHRPVAALEKLQPFMKRLVYHNYEKHIRQFTTTDKLVDACRLFNYSLLSPMEDMLRFDFITPYPCTIEVILTNNIKDDVAMQDVIRAFLTEAKIRGSLIREEVHARVGD